MVVHTARNAVVLGLLCVAVGCRETGPPTIVRVEGDTVVSANDSTTYECIAWDWDYAPIEFTWSSSRGALVVETTTVSHSRIRWHAPDSSGPVLIGVVVTDLDGMTDSDSVLVSVAKVTTTLIDCVGAVKTEQYRRWSDGYRPGYAVEGSFSVEDSNQLAFLMLDAPNYSRWVAGQSCDPLVAIESAIESSFSTTIPTGGTYHVLMDNTQGNCDKGFRLRVRRTTP